MLFGEGGEHVDYTREIRKIHNIIRDAEKRLRGLEGVRRKSVMGKLGISTTKKAMQYGWSIEEFNHRLFSKFILSSEGVRICVSVTSKELDLTCYLVRSEDKLQEYYSRKFPLSYGEVYLVNKVDKILDKVYSTECNLNMKGRN